MGNKMLVKAALVLFIISITLSSCASVNNQKTVQVDKNKINFAIQNAMTDDYGYRLATDELLNVLDMYTTFYALESKDLLGIDTKNDRNSILNYVKDRSDEILFQKDSNDNLVQIYYYCMINKFEKLDPLIAQKIKEYVLSLQTKHFSFGYSEKNRDMLNKASSTDIAEILSTYMAINVLKMTGDGLSDINNINLWLNNMVKIVMLQRFSQSDECGYITMLLKIYKMLGIDYSNDFNIVDINKKIDSFDKKIKEINPQMADFLSTDLVFIRELIDLHQIMGIEITPETIKDIYKIIVTNNNGKNELYYYKPSMPDSLAIYNSLYILNKLGYDCHDYTYIKPDLEKFKLSNGGYVLFSSFKSNIVNTYCVYQISKILSLDNNIKVKEYYKNNKIKVLTGNPVGRYYLLQLLSDENSMNLISDIKDNLENEIINNISTISNSESISKYMLLMYCIKSLKLIGCDFNKNLIETIKTNIEKEDNVSDKNFEIIIQCYKLELMRDIGFQNDFLKKKYINNISSNIDMVLSCEITGKIQLLYQMITCLNDYNYNFSDEDIDNIVKFINLTKHNSGLFSGGTLKEDLPSFSNTFCALQILKKLNVLLIN